MIRRQSPLVVVTSGAGVRRRIALFGVTIVLNVRVTVCNRLRSRGFIRSRATRLAWQNRRQKLPKVRRNLGSGIGRSLWPLVRKLCNGRSGDSLLNSESRRRVAVLRD